MFSCTFLRIIRQSIQVLCPVFPRTVFFRIANKVWTSKTSLSVGRQDFVQHGARVISAAKQPEILHVPLVATNELLSQSPNSIFGTRFFLRETLNSLPGTNKLAFTGNMNSLLKGTKLAFLGNINSPCRIKLSIQSFLKNIGCATPAAELNEKELTIKHLSAGTQKNMADKAARMISH